MTSRAYSDDELESVTRLVSALADESFSTAPWDQHLAACGLAIDGEPTADGEIRFSAAELGLDGNGTIARGRLTFAGLFPPESRPPDEEALREMHARLSGLLSAQWGHPRLHPAEAPRSTWHAGDLDVSLDCYWANGQVGLIMISVQPNDQAVTADRP